MKKAPYTILPDVAHHFDERRATLDLFVCDVEIVLHRQIPPFNVFNLLLRRGYTPRIGEREPFEIERTEYDAIAAARLANPADRFALLEPPEEFCTPEAWWAWLASIGPAWAVVLSVACLLHLPK